MRMVKVVVLALAAGCGGGSPEAKSGTPTTSTGSPSRPLAEKYRACVALLDAAKPIDFERDCVEANVAIHAVGGRAAAQGAEPLTRFFQSRKAAMPDARYRPQLVMVSGRTILAVHLVTGTHTGALKTSAGELAATNKKVGQLVF